MTIRTRYLAMSAAVLLAGTALPAMATTLRYANQGDLKSLDPYTLNETTTNAHLGHVYEGLTRRGKDLAVQPGLAEKWEISERAHLALLPAQRREVSQRQSFHR
jgi:peptide/nickel transport system substrate-binding protein